MKTSEKTREQISNAASHSSKLKKKSKRWRIKLDYIQDYISYMRDYE